jgi:uroporphyrinogen-III synthase
MLHERAPVPATLVLTRPAPASRRFLAQIKAETGAKLSAIISPLFEIVPMPHAPLGEGDVILTSANAVTALTPEDRAGGRTAWCVGEATASAAGAAGMYPRSADGDADALVDLIRAESPPTPLWHLHGRHVTGDIAARLQVAGFHVESRAIYDQAALPLTPEAQKVLGGDTPVVVPLFSPRTAALFAQNAPFAAPLHAVAISQAAAAPLAALPLASLTVAETPDAAAMLRSTCRILQSAE